MTYNARVLYRQQLKSLISMWNTSNTMVMCSTLLKKSAWQAWLLKKVLY